MTHLYLIRHGEAYSNVERDGSGTVPGLRGDKGLTPRGRRDERLYAEEDENRGMDDAARRNQHNSLAIMVARHPVEHRPDPQQERAPGLAAGRLRLVRIQAKVHPAIALARLVPEQPIRRAGA